LEDRQRLPAPKARGRKGGSPAAGSARLPGGLHRAWRNDEGKPMDAWTQPLATRAGRCPCNHPRSGSGLALLPVFVGFGTLFPL